MGFTTLNLHESVLKAVIDAGYDAPTAVQAQAVPAAIEGRDLMVSSRTGSGKTAAFMLPALHRLALPARGKGRGPRVLVLTPTRELAQQVTQATIKYGRHLRHAKAVSIVGGVAYPVQNRLLAQPYEILVATPGRLIDQMKSGRIDFSRLETLVLDEADRMLDMGFIEDIEHIISELPKERQTLLFSATLDDRIGRLAGNMLKDPLRIEIESTGEEKANIEQRLLYADDLSHKNKLLDHILRDVEVKQAIVFTATKRDADLLAANLDEAGLGAAALHGDMGQGQRNRTIMRLRRGELRVLVATDVAARGLDVDGISHVVNFDLPKSVEDYVHRIGRTGRAGRSGIAISFANRRDQRHVKAIEHFTSHTITVHTVPGLEPRIPVRAGFDGPARSGGGYRGNGAPGGSGGGYRGNSGSGGGYQGNGGGYRGNAAPAGSGGGYRGNAGAGNGGGGYGANRGEARTGERKPFGERPYGENRGNFAGDRPRFNDDNRGNVAPRPRFGDDDNRGNRIVDTRPARVDDDNRGNVAERPRFGADRPAGAKPFGDRKPFGDKKPFGDRPRREGGFGAKPAFNRGGDR